MAIVYVNVNLAFSQGFAKSFAAFGGEKKEGVMRDTRPGKG